MGRFDNDEKRLESESSDINILYESKFLTINNEKSNPNYIGFSFCDNNIDFGFTIPIERFDEFMNAINEAQKKLGISDRRTD
jgi:hypothetical protein